MTGHQLAGAILIMTACVDLVIVQVLVAPRVSGERARKIVRLATVVASFWMIAFGAAFLLGAFAGD